MLGRLLASRILFTLTAILLAVVLGPLVWLAVWPGLCERTVWFDLTLPAEEEARGDWALTWERGGRENGAWILPPVEATTATLTIEHDGGRGPTGAARRLWLYGYSVDGGERRDAVELLTRARTTGSWRATEGGVIADGPGPGSLRVELPRGELTLFTAATPNTGTVRIAWDGGVQVADLESAAVEPRRIVLEEPQAVPLRIKVSQRVPAKAGDGLHLAWRNAAGEAILTRPMVRRSILGVVLPSVPLEMGELSGARGVQTEKGARLYELDGAGELAIGPLPGFHWREHAVGAGLLSLVIVGVLLGVRAVWSITAGPGGRWISTKLSPELVAWLVVLGVQTGMLWAPVVYAPDSLDYFLGARAILEDGDWRYFNAARLPGYGLVVAAAMKLAGAGSLNFALGAIQTGLHVLTTVMAASIARRVTPRPWPAVVVLLVGLHPLLTLWARVGLSECVATFIATLTFWLLSRRWSVATPGMWVMACAQAMVLGVVCAAGAYVRGNFQLLVVLMPAAAAWIAWSHTFTRREFVRAAVVAFAGWVVAAGCLAPWVVRNEKQYGRTAFVIGSGYMRLLMSWNAGVVDPNQTAVVGPEEAARLVEGKRSRQVSDFEYLSTVSNSSVITGDEDLNPWVRQDERGAWVSDESLARDPIGRLEAAGRNLLEVLWLWPYAESRTLGETLYWTKPLRGESWGTGTNHPITARDLGEPRATTHAWVFERTAVNTARWESNWSARILNDAAHGWLILRVAVGVFFVIGTVIAVVRGRWLVAALGVVTAVHALAIAWLAFTSIDRYTLPFEAAAVIVAVFGLWNTGRNWSRGRAFAKRGWLDA